MSGLEVAILILAAALCLIGFLAFGKRRAAEAAPAPSDGPTIRVIELTMVPGAYFEKWCDDCNRAHGWVTVYAYEGDDMSTARPIGIAAVPDDVELQDGDA